MDIAIYKKQSELFRAESHRWLETILGSIGDAVIASDTEGTVTFINPVARRLTGWDTNTAVGKPVHEVFQIVSEDTGKVKEDPVSRVLKDGIIVEFSHQTLLLNTAGFKVPITDSAAPITNDEGKIIGVVLVFRDQTEERKIQKALEYSENILRNTQSIAKIGNWSWNIDTEEMTWSDALFQVFQCNSQKPSINLFKTIVHHDDVDLWVNSLEKAIKESKPFELEYRVIGENGNIIWIKNKATFIEESGNSIFFGTAQDITEQKVTQKALIDTTEILHEAQRFAKIGSWRYDPATKMSTWTDEMFHIFGLKPQAEALPYEEHRKIIHPDDWDRFDTAVNRAVSAGIGYDIELKITRPSGELAYLNARCDAEKNTLGEVIQLIGTTQDITDRRLAEDDLRKSEENYRNLFENMAQGAFYQSSDGRLLNVNYAALEMFGLTYDQFVGKTSKDPQWNVIREDGSDFPGEEHPSMVALKTGKPCKDVVAGIYSVENSYNWVTINAVPQFKENESKPYQVFVTMHDITARKQSEDLLRIQHDLSYQLSDVESFEKGLGICLNSCLNASNMEAGGIYLLNKETGGIDLVYHKGLPTDFIKNVQYFGPDSEHVNILKKKTAFYTQYKHLAIPQTEAEQSADLKAICIIPILFQDYLIGCINLTSSIVRKVPDFSRVAIETIASQIGSWVNYNRTKQTLNESEDRFSLAMDAAQDGMYDWNLIKNTIYYSPGWKRMLGYKDSELPNDFSIWEKLTDPIDVERAWQMQNELITQQRDRFEIEFKMRHKDGHWVDILSRATAIFDDMGTAVRIVGTHVDITELKQAEKRHSDLLHFNKKIISESPIGLAIYESDSGNCIAANDSVAQLLGGTKEEVRRQNFYELESWKTSELLALAQEVLKSNISQRRTIEITSSFGKAIAIDCYFTQFSFSDKQHLLLATTDVTQKLKDEKTIKRQREKAERYLNLAGVMFIGLDKEGHINLANKKACQILEVHQKDVLGQNWFDNYISQDKRDDVHSVFQQIISGNIQPFEYYENSVVSKTGKEKHIAWHNTALKDVDGNIIGLLGSGDDITEKKQLRSKLQQAQKMESIGTLAGGIAHDFNNILSSILGFSELALSGVEKGSEVEDDLQEVITAGIRAKDLVKQILTFARQSDETVKPIQVRTIVQEALKFLKSSIPANIQIENKINSDSFIMGSPTQVHQIMMNLCTNASQAMEADGGILEVSLEDVTIKKSTQISGLNSGEYIKITVKDTGIGISAMNITTIFEPYFTTKKVGDGTGMGLAVVHGIVESYGGRITVNSSISNGSTFSVYLPITKKRKQHGNSEKIVFPSGHEQILFVDDEAALAKMGSRTLEKLGYHVTVRTSSVEALELFKSNPKDFDLVITDMTMPNMTGDKLAVELMAIRPDIPVILCTGYSKAVSEENIEELGIKAFIYKPIAKADLAKTVRNILDKV